MSHNLYFKMVGTDECVDFPIQLPTNISRLVMEVDVVYDRLDIIVEYLYDCKWTYAEVDDMVKRMLGMMQDKNLTLEIN